MALQLLRQIYDVARKFVGLPGELRVDESNWDLILDDGATVGGRRFYSGANADERYQPRSQELDGLLGFEPQEKGFLVRRGPSDYRVRTIEVNTDSLVLTNPKGYDGNPKASLAAEVKSSHKWSGDHEFTQMVQGKGGFIGDLDGDVTGNVTGNLTGDSTGKHTGSVDTSGGNLTLAANQVKLAWLEEVIRLRLVPVGCILLWSGAANAIPTGFRLCNGANGTPDLRDRFVVGAGGTLAVGDSAPGSVTLELSMSESGAHTHEGTVGETTLTIEQIPQHEHMNGVVDKNDNLFNHGGVPAVPGLANSIDGNSSNGTREGKTTQVGGGMPHTHDLTQELGGAHSHLITVDELEVVQPYYALCYIMKGN